MNSGMGWYDTLGGLVFDHLLVPLSDVFLGYFGLGIIVFTLFVRFVLLPITIRQFRGSREMQWKLRALRPRLEELNQRYKGDRRKLAQETMKIYGEAGISPVGCLTSPMMMSMAVQMPILVAMIAAVRYASIIPDAANPESMVRVLQEGLNPHFLWLDLAERDITFVLPILVAVVMLFSQMLVSPPGDDRLSARAMRIVTILSMPAMFFWICAVNPSGLALYWLISMLVTLGIQYYVWRGEQPELAIATSSGAVEADPSG